MISVSQLTRKFKDFVAVDHLDFEVRAGEIFAFLGPNGAGKSTTIKMLTTLLRPTEGRAVLNGFDVHAQQAGVRRSIGVVFQDPSLDSELTARENMEIHAVLYGVPRAERAERIRALLEFVELWGRRDDLVSTFSGGMKRRLEIARGLLHHPQVLFLDEPTLGLDPQTRNHVWDYVRRLNETEGTTIFFTTHYMQEAEQVAHRIAIMDHGRLVATGTVAELRERTGGANLEEAFLALTGRDLRDEELSGSDQMRAMMRSWGRGRR